MPAKKKNGQTCKSIQVRNTDALELIDAIGVEYPEIKTGAGIIHMALKEHLPMVKKIDRLEVQVYNLQNNLAKIKSTLKDFKKLCDLDLI